MESNEVVDSFNHEEETPIDDLGRFDADPGVKSYDPIGKYNKIISEYEARRKQIMFEIKNKYLKIYGSSYSKGLSTTLKNMIASSDYTGTPINKPLEDYMNIMSDQQLHYEQFIDLTSSSFKDMRNIIETMIKLVLDYKKIVEENSPENQERWQRRIRELEDVNRKQRELIGRYEVYGANVSILHAAQEKELLEKRSQMNSEEGKRKCLRELIALQVKNKQRFTLRKWEELEEDYRIPSSTVAEEVERMVKEGYIIKVDETQSGGTLYESALI